MQSDPETLKKATELFNQEADRLLQLGDHPQIPTLFAYFEEDNYLYLVQQFIQGQDLLHELEEQGTFTETKIRELLNDLLPVLQFIHDHKVIHRDLKPENIMRRQIDGKLVLIDFGVAKQKGGSLLTQQGTTVGTPGYAPMEQMNGVTYPASDLYSLAVTCIRLMTGCLRNMDGSDELFNHFEGGWAWRDKLLPGTTIGEPLGQVLDKLLQDYVKQRYQSATEVLTALNQQPISPPSQPVAQPLGTTIIVNPPPSQPVAQPVTPRMAVNLPSSPVQPNTPTLALQTFEFEVATLKITGYQGFLNKTAVIQSNKSRKRAEYFAENLGSGVILEMVAIPDGTFMMGLLDSEEGYSSDESPQHRVTVAPFFMGKYPITQEQYESVMGKNPSRFKGKKRPVENVSWHQANDFCQKLSQKTGKKYRLPSEAEWEYACRAGTTTPFHFGETITTDVANYHGNSTYGSASKGVYRQETTDVGSFSANNFGLYDMHGNVWEWCADPWHENYNGAPTDGSIWESGGDNTRRPLRGGSWYDLPWDCRGAARVRGLPDVRFTIYGFRVVLSA
jgi:formylglycine-generating enzyme required for sulfatase activity